MKTVLVTGASRGIGFSITEALLNAGFRVIGTGTSEKIHSIHNSSNFTGVVCDLSNRSDVELKLKPIFQNDSCPDVIINNAGISEPCSFESTDEEWDLNWNRVLHVNLLSPVQLVKWAIPVWKKRRSGIHIAITSRAAYRGETEDYASYAASKSGLTGVNKTIARGYGKDGIVSFAIAPGFTLTDMMKEAIPVYGEDYIKRENVIGEVAPPEEIADLCLVLASGKLSHMSGQTFHINSGSYMI
jgi:NAD(P)-dependent dehydrogenase (short-subunit alcohol dehydrogenase family)